MTGEGGAGILDIRKGDGKMKDLAQCRREIDAVDRQLLRLFEERMALCREVAAYKEAHGLPALDASREAAVLEALGGKTSPELLPYARRLWQTLMDLSKEYQGELRAGK